ncbi:MAG: hypothetical protein AAFN40_03445 [Cyanobacteria bacterium J06560_6]
MLLKQAAKVVLLAGLASVASTLVLSRPARADCYLFDLICFDSSDSRNTDRRSLPDEVASPDVESPPRRRVPPIGTTRTVRVTETYRLTRIQLPVRARLPWVDTGIDLSPGELLSIEAAGMWSTGGENPLQTDANGYPDAYSPQSLDSRLPFASLIGVVGNGDPFFVGESSRDTIVTGGRLFLSMNDIAESFDDNSGGVRVTILIKQPL